MRHRDPKVYAIDTDLPPSTSPEEGSSPVSPWRINSDGGSPYDELTVRRHKVVTAGSTTQSPSASPKSIGRVRKGSSFGASLKDFLSSTTSSSSDDTLPMTFSQAREARTNSKGKRRNSVQLLDESEHGVEKTIVETEKRRRSLSEGAAPNGGGLVLENPQQGHKQRIIGWGELTKVVFYREGTFSLCFTALYKGAEVVVKLLKSDAEKIDERAEELFATEIAVMLGGVGGAEEGSTTGGGRSRHLVKMIGRGREKLGSFVVLEKLTMTLEERLGNCRSSGGLLSFPWWGNKKKDAWKDDLGLRMKTCLELARGLEFCHKELGYPTRSCIIHRDFNPKNIGFRDDGGAVLFDFGLARVLDSYTAVSNAMPRAMTGEVGSCRYQAPEVSCHSPYGAQSDVWSWAVVAWEMCSLALPYGEITVGGYLSRVVEGGERLRFEGDEFEGWDGEWKALLGECWDENMSKRPCMSDVVKRLEAIMKKV